MQSLRSHGAGQPEFDAKVASQASSIYSPQDCWNMTYPGEDGSKISADSMRFHPYNTFVGSAVNFPTTTAISAHNSHAPYPTRSMFTAVDSMERNQDTPTISPLQTHCDSSDASQKSFNELEPQPFANSTGPSNEQNGGLTPRRDSHSPNSKPSSSGRKRRSENVKIGSSRAVYLEKNRAAASKCRNKQKRQQEELVEEAREVERKNRLLKAEAEMLREGVRELMVVVGQHNNCTDSRIKLYIQLQADRLATGELRRMEFAQQLEMSSQNYGDVRLKQESPPDGQ